MVDFERQRIEVAGRLITITSWYDPQKKPLEGERTKFPAHPG